MNVTNVYARGVNVNLTPLTSNRGALATDARGCSLCVGILGFETRSALDTSLDDADPGGGVTYTLNKIINATLFFFGPHFS